jgi:hypothetical protein
MNFISKIFFKKNIWVLISYKIHNKHMAGIKPGPKEKKKILQEPGQANLHNINYHNKLRDGFFRVDLVCVALLTFFCLRVIRRRSEKIQIVQSLRYSIMPFFLQYLLYDSELLILIHFHMKRIVAF